MTFLKKITFVAMLPVVLCGCATAQQDQPLAVLHDLDAPKPVHVVLRPLPKPAPAPVAVVTDFVAHATIYGYCSGCYRPVRSDYMKLTEAIKSRHATSVVVTGGTDSTGSAALNKRLARRRAEWLAAALIRDGIAPEVITVKDDDIEGSSAERWFARKVVTTISYTKTTYKPGV